MNVEILLHDETTGLARVRFTHNNVVHEDTYDLTLVIPGSKKLFAELGQEFTKEKQLQSLDSLTTWIQKDIESGVLTNRME